MSKISKGNKQVAFVSKVMTHDFSNWVDNGEVSDMLNETLKIDNAAFFIKCDLVSKEYITELDRLKKREDGCPDIPNNDLRPIAAKVAMRIGKGEVVKAEEVITLAVMSKVFTKSFGRNKASVEAYKYALNKCSENMTDIDGVTKDALNEAIKEYVEIGVQENKEKADPDINARAAELVALAKARLEMLDKSGFLKAASYNDLDAFCCVTERANKVCQVAAASTLATA